MLLCAEVDFIVMCGGGICLLCVEKECIVMCLFGLYCYVLRLNLLL